MAGEWDYLIKSLFDTNPQAFVSLLIPGARLLSKPSVELINQILDADRLYNIIIDDFPAVLHIEFQRYRDKDMARRIWEYNVLATCNLKLPVISIVIYLIRDGQIVEGPYSVKDHEGSTIHWFSFRSIKLWDYTVEDLRESELVEILPLMFFAKDGKRPEVVEEVANGLVEAGKSNMLTLAYVLAAGIFKDVFDDEWLRKRFAMQENETMLEHIMKESWVYKEIIQKGHEEGLKEGLKEELQRQRRTLMSIVQMRFPALESLASERAEHIHDPQVLQEVIIALLSASSEEKATEYITGAANGKLD